MHYQPSRLFTAAATVAALVVAGACADQAGPGPTALTAGGPLLDHVPDGVAGDEFAGHVEVCKIGPAGTYDFSVSQEMITGIDATLGTLDQGGFFDLAANGVCEIVWTKDAPESTDPLFDNRVAVTVTELTPLPAGTEFDSIKVEMDTEGATAEFSKSGMSATVNVNYFHGARITFFNSEVPGGGEGCTPGYWKQSQHFDSWVVYSPNDDYADVFGVTGPDMDLGDALAAKGGGENALLRHSTAALLNAANPDVDYLYTVAQVIQMVQDAYDSGDFEATKNLFEAQNEMGCPLN